MRKFVAVTCAVVMMASLAGCGADYSNTTVVGQVTEINGTKVTLQLGEMAEMELPEGMEDMFGGEIPQWGNGQMPDWGTGEMPEGGMGEFPGMPEGEMPQMPQGEIPESSTGNSGDIQWGIQSGEGMPQWGNGEVPEMPEGEFGEMPEMPEGGFGEMPQMPEGSFGEIPEGFGDMMPGGMGSFVAGDEELTIDLENVTISFSFGQMTMQGDISMISEGSILTIEYGDDNTILSVIVQSGGNRENMGRPKGSELAHPYS